jgi:2-dehydropantoate 2-reductase
MRFIVFGAGAVGGVVGARLAQHGHDVVLIARGAHLDALRTDGITVESADDRATVRLPAYTGPDEIEFNDDDVVLLGVKAQATKDALDALRAAASATTPVVCLQNGVENERVALRLFEHVYAVCVMCPATHLEPGVVQAYSSPISGLLDIGRYPNGLDGTAYQIAAALQASTFESVPRADIMRWKYTKLLMNLANAVEALCGHGEPTAQLARLVRDEGIACLRAAGIAFASNEEDRERRGDRLKIRPIAGQRRGGGSSWQSLARGTGSIESDYLNGEIVLLGRRYGVPTPANDLVRELANEAARARRPPGATSAAAVLAMLSRR